MRILPTQRAVASVKAERFAFPRAEAEFAILATVTEDAELFLRDIRKILKNALLAGGDLTRASILEVRALFAFWSNHILGIPVTIEDSGCAPS